MWVVRHANNHAHCNALHSYQGQMNNSKPQIFHYCLDGKKGIWPVKTEWSGEVLVWLSVWSKVQMICVWSGWCHRHPIISCSSKIQNGLPFWCQVTQVVLEKKAINTCSTRMWANAQPDGCPAEHRWRPLFNAAKFGWCCQDAKPIEICRGAPNSRTDLSR